MTLKPTNAPAIQLRRNISTVTLEIDLDNLWQIFDLLAAHGQTDLLRRYLVQLHNEEFLDENEAAIIAEHYQITPPHFH